VAGRCRDERGALARVTAAVLRVVCRCGATLYTENDRAGRRVRCGCGRTLLLSKRRHPLVGLARRGLFPAAVAYAVLSLLAVVVVWGVSDRIALGTIVLFGPRWLLLLPLGLLLPAALVLHRRALAPLAVALFLILVPVMDVRPGLRPLLERRSAGETLSVATFNAAGRVEALQAFVWLMEEQGTEVAGIQECPRGLPLIESRGWNVVRNGSLCVVSRYPVRLEGLLDLDLDRTRAMLRLGGTSEGARYLVQAPHRELQLANLHLETPRRGLKGLFTSEAERLGGNLVMRDWESRKAHEWLGEEQHQLIVVGDFNMPVESTIYRQSWSAYGNAFSQAGRGWGMTRDNGWIRVRIDHVLSGRDWRTEKAWVGPAIGSDHRPVFARLSWRGERAHP
jgi:vancomycin resistance protein VanJ